jgi:hypothetical protein
LALTENGHAQLNHYQPHMNVNAELNESSDSSSNQGLSSSSTTNSLFANDMADLPQQQHHMLGLGHITASNAVDVVSINHKQVLSRRYLCRRNHCRAWFPLKSDLMYVPFSL